MSSLVLVVGTVCEWRLLLSVVDDDPVEASDEEDEVAEVCLYIERSIKVGIRT